MSKFNSEEIVKIVEKLNGNLAPVGETNADERSYENLKRLENILDELLDSIQWLFPNRNSYEYSVKRIGDEAVTYLRSVRENINEWMKEYGVEE